MGRNFRLVKLYQTDEAVPSSANTLNIDSKNIAFMQAGLFQQLQLKQSGNEWWLEFFVKSSVKQRLVVEFKEIPDVKVYLTTVKESNRKGSRNQYLSPLTQMVYVDSDNPKADVDSCCFASQMIKGSKSIQVEHLHHASTHCSYIDGRGMVYIAKSYIGQATTAGYAQFQRHVLLIALAYAYLAAMDKLSNQISTTLFDANEPLNEETQEAKLRQLYKDVIMFNAQCFFQEPVALHAPALREAWLLIDTKLGIRDANNQLFRQIENVHFIVDLEVSKREKSWQLKLTYLGIFIAVFSALSVIDIIIHWLK